MSYTKIFILMIFMIGCSNNSTDPEQTVQLSGHVYYDGVPAANAIIRVDESPAHTSATDQAGYFEVANLKKGSHMLNIYKDIVDQSYSTKTIPIELNQDIYFNQLLLPRGVRLLEPENVSDNSMWLRWTSTNAPDFREYKIFRHETSGLDETTGTLIHVATGITDTTFNVISLNPYQTYFYRVYIMNDIGKLGGSNIVSATTQNINLITNGSFEIIDAYTEFADGWETSSSLNKYASIDPTRAHEGTHSVRFHTAAGEYSFTTISIDLDPKLLLPAKKYELSMWITHDSLALNHTGWIDIPPAGSHLKHFDGPHKPSGWNQHKEIINTPPDMTGSYYGFQFHYAQILDEMRLKYRSTSGSMILC